MKLIGLTIVALALLVSAGAQTQYIQVCTFSTAVPQCKFVPLSSIQTTVNIGTTTTGAAGTAASVTNSGTPQAVMLNFTIPRGVDGINGTNGQDGAPGKDGTNGKDGATGPQGPPGPAIPGLTFVVNPDGTTSLSLNGSFQTTEGGDGAVVLSGFKLFINLTTGKLACLAPDGKTPCL